MAAQTPAALQNATVSAGNRFEPATSGELAGTTEVPVPVRRWCTSDATQPELGIGSRDVPYRRAAEPHQGTPTTIVGDARGVSTVGQTYTVAAGDTVEGIANRYGFPSSQLDVLVDYDGWRAQR